MTAASPQGSKVYRLRGIPEHLDRLDITRLLSDFLPDDGSSGDIHIASLAPSCDFSSLSPTKTATLTFSKLPSAVRDAAFQREWSFSLPGLARPLVLDDTFFGLTSLNDVPRSQHKYDCIVISGLASHPMGSWQPRGPDKSFMWIRDALPKMATHVRFILYGYDTTLVGSNSFQTVSDLAVSLINELKAGGWTSPAAKPLIFFAHSLGGVVLKQAFVMLAGSGAREVALLSQTKGAILFGVPSQGMPMSDLLSMLGTQPNTSALVADISEHSQFLPQLERQVSGISHVRQMSLVWAYETQTTPTVVCVNGQYQRSGPPAILVSKESATGGRCESDPTSTIQIDANHSEMVKFSPGHHLISLIAYKLDIISQHEPMTTLGPDLDMGAKPLQPVTEPDVSPRLHSLLRMLEQSPDPSFDPEFWDTQAIIESLKPSMRSSRLEQIDERAGHSFEWVFDRPSIGLMPWLHEGSGVFWISGRPGSGKSTMMKFLHNDPRTSQAIEESGWKRGARQIRASFFFHHRGTAAQKSFQGLTQSILSQILEQEPKLLTALTPMFQEEYQKGLEISKLGTLRSDLAAMLDRSVRSGELTIDDSLHNRLEDVLACELWRKKFRELVKLPLLESDSDGPHWVELESESFASAWPLINGEGDDSDSGAVWEPERYPEHWGNALKSRFRLLISKWRVAVDIKAKLRQLVGSKDAKIDMIQLTSILNHYQLRQSHRLEIEKEVWIVHRLVRALSFIIKQDAVSIDVCLFLDALDEYDGQPETISKFIHDLTRNHDNSSTRIRVLFSSRSWNVFLNEFGNGPGFRIHEHTESDVQELCARYIKPDMPGSRELIRIIPQIVQRAQGVFLWARLVLDNLCSVTAKYAEDHQAAHLLREKLLATLRNLPHDLADYYKDIIQRIPATLRLDTYCLLEAVCRSETALSLGAVPLLLASNKASNIHQLKEITSKLTDRPDREAEDQLRAVSGGLVDLVPHVAEGHGNTKTGPGYNLQLLHQTVLDFVEQPQFKQIVLGLRARITEENGHSFLVRYLLCQYGFAIDGPVLHHAREFERTTGLSMFGFLKGRGFILAGLNLHLSAEQASISLVGLAIAGGLRLLLNDILDEDVNAIATSDDSLLSLISWSIEKGLCTPEDVISTVRFILSRGFSPLRDLSGLSRLLVELRFISLPRVTTVALEELSSFTRAVLDGCDDVNIRIYVDSFGCHSTLLHFSSLKVAKYLLDRGANPNALDSEGRTPLDFICSDLPREVYLMYDRGDICDLIASHGGVFCNESIKQLIWDGLPEPINDLKLGMRFLRRSMRDLVLAEDHALARLLKETPAVPLPDFFLEPNILKPSSRTADESTSEAGDAAGAPQSTDTTDNKVWDDRTTLHEGEWEDDSSSDDAGELGGAPLV